jgi:hypothetical protein
LERGGGGERKRNGLVKDLRSKLGTAEGNL